MLNAFSRTELAIGEEGLKILRESSVAVLGIGGVGSYAAEALARAGIGKLLLVDRDVVDITNINRQIHALHSTIGRSKALLMAERIKEINPEAEVTPLQIFYSEETREAVFRQPLDYVVDAIDTITHKIHLVMECKRRGIPIVSSMGAANKMDPTAFRVADLAETSYDPIARVMRRKLKEAGITGVKVVYSKEEPLASRPEVMEQIVADPDSPISKVRQPPASISFVPPVAGMILASVVVKDLLGIGR